MSTSVESNNLYNSNLSAITEIDTTERSINTYNTNQNGAQNDTINDGQSAFCDSLPPTKNEKTGSDNQQIKEELMTQNIEQENKNQTCNENMNVYLKDEIYNEDENDKKNNDEKAPLNIENRGNRHYNKEDLEPEQFRKVFVGGLSYKTDHDTMYEYFSKFGEIADHVVMKDSHTNKPKGFGFVIFFSNVCLSKKCMIFFLFQISGYIY